MVIQRKPRPMPWRMCRTCHRAGTSTHGACPRTSHPLEGIGACGQCGKRRPLVTCHGYDFRRRSSLSRSSSTASALTRKKKAARKPRKASETERAHGPEEFRAWMKSQPCIVPGCAAGVCDAAHVHSGGTGRKDDWTQTVPLCSTRMGYVGHHERYDNAKRSFPLTHGLDMDAEAAANYARWQDQLNQRKAS